MTSRDVRLILGLALLVRAVCWLPGARHTERFFTDDAFGYVRLAADLHAGYLDPQSSTFFVGLVRTPVYPVFLGFLMGIFRGSLPAVVATQIGISVLTVWLTCVLATRLLGRRAALASGILLSLDPVSALFSCLLQPETLFTALLVTATLCWLRAVEHGTWEPAAGAGLILDRHPKVGASWEGFGIAQVVKRLGASRDECYFWATQSGAELDLLVVRGRRRLGFEFKRTLAPQVTRSMHIAKEDLRLTSLDVVHAGDGSFPRAPGIRALALKRLLVDLKPLR